MTYTVSSGTLNSTIPYHTIPLSKMFLSCRRSAATICLCPLQVDIVIYIHQVAPILACWLFRHPQQVDLLTLKMVSESRMTWATSVPILVFLGLSVLELGPMYVTDIRRQTKASLNASALWGGGIIRSFKVAFQDSFHSMLLLLMLTLLKGVVLWREFTIQNIATFIHFYRYC